MKMKYNNEQDFLEIITYRYSSQDFAAICDKLKSNNNINIFDILDSDKMECIRKIEDTKYVLLLSEENERLFIFFDSDNIVTDSYYIEKDFLEQSDFKNIQENVTLESDVETLDKSPVYYPISAKVVTGHIVKEGIIIIEYDSLLNGEILNDPVVKSIHFFDDDEILTKMESDVFVSNTPYILPKDKQNQMGK